MNIMKLVSRNMFRRKGRFVFTLLGISIGMSAFVALMSLGQNMENEIARQADALGADFIITPENICIYNQMAILTGETITELLPEEIFERINAIEGLEVIPHLTQNVRVNGNEPRRVAVGILPEETWQFRDWELSSGRFFAHQDEAVIVLGSVFEERGLFGLGDMLTIGRDGETFEVVGFLKGNNSTDDMTIFLPLSVVQETFQSDKGRVISYMSAKVDDVANIPQLEADIHAVANVQVSTDEQLLGAVMTIVNSVNVTLQLVAAVSLLAAAFGVVNTMMTAITERRREIGVLRAIGGKRNTIFRIFIVESGLYGLFGGIVGVVVGLTASMFAAPLITQGVAGELLKGANLEVINFDVTVITAAIGLSLIIAILAGLYPAWKASKLTPVEAISYE